MLMEKVPDLDWPHDLYRAAVAHRRRCEEPGNGFLEERDFAANRIEWLTKGDVRRSVVRFQYESPMATAS